MERWNSEHRVFAGDLNTKTPQLEFQGRQTTRQTIFNRVKNFRATASAQSKKDIHEQREQLEIVEMVREPKEFCFVGTLQVWQKYETNLTLELNVHTFKLRLGHELRPAGL